MELYSMGGCTLLLKIGSYDDKQLKGTIYNPYTNTLVPFSGLMQIISSVNEMIDSSSALADRESIFNSARNETGFHLVEGAKPWLKEKKRTLAEFKLQIRFRRFGTWQGSISCMNSGNSSAFRNIVELALMLDSELAAAAAGRGAAVAEA